MAPKKRNAPSSGYNTMLRYLKKGKVSENAGANREELGEEGVTGGGAAGEGVAGGGVAEEGVAGGGAAGGGAAGGGAAGGGSEAPPCVEQAPPCVKQEKAEELHEHTISWQYEKPKYTWSCKKYGIYESLQESDKFREIEQKAPEKELVILITPKKAISSHFPCQHIPTKNLTVKYIKAQDNKTKTTTESIKNPSKIIIFSVKTAGSKNIINVVMKNHELKNTVDEVLVYAYKGQTVREALEQDGRFSDEILQSNYLLEDTEDGKRTEMSSMVHILNDKCFTVLRSSKKAKQKDETPQEATSSRTESSKSNQPTPNVSNQPTPNMSNQPPTYQPIPGSEDLLELLRSQFKELVKRMKERQNLSPKAVQQLFSQEYGKNSKLCHEVRTMRKFLELSNSVCQVRIDGWAVGTGFLLFGKYILTNAHVVLDQAKRRENITVIFSYEELSDSQAMGVTVVAHDFRRDTARHKHDWALLEVCGDLNTQSENAQPLLKHLGLVTERGQICIIGHPEGKVKMIDPCYTIPCNERKEKMEISVTSHYLFPDPMDRDIQTYESCFYDGASGSPVFDHSFKVVSMHSGGFNDEQTKERVLEYSHPLSLIMEQIIIQIVRKRKVLVLWAMITCGIPPVVIAGLRGKVEPTEFVWTADEMKNLTESVGGELSKVKEFFKFFENSETDEPMDVS
ncbi:unnamed protein product [Lota lota]